MRQELSKSIISARHFSYFLLKIDSIKFAWKLKISFNFFFASCRRVYSKKSNKESKNQKSKAKYCDNCVKREMKNESDWYCVQTGQFGEGFEKTEDQVRKMPNFDLNYLSTM